MTSNSRDSTRGSKSQRIDLAHQSFVTLGEALDEFDIGFIQLSPETTALQTVNGTFARMLGREPKDLQELQLSGLAEDEHQSDVVDVVRSLRQETTGRVVREYSMSRSDESPVWLRYTFVANQAADENALVICATAIDVTPAKSVEDELRLANDHFDAAQANSKVGSWEWPEDQAVGWWSKQLYELHNMDPTLGPPTFEEFIELVDPKDRPTIMEINQPPFYVGDVRRFEFSSNPAFGPRRYFAATVWMAELDGRIVRRGTTQDVTRQVELLSALQQSEKQYREVVVSNAEGTAILNLDGKILQADEKFASMLGQSLGGLDGMDICQLADAASAKLIDERMLNRNQSEAHEVRIKHSDGHLVWLLLTCSPLINDSDQFAGIQARALDITHRKHVELLTQLAAEAKAKLERLTNREREVLEQIVEGRMNKVIANRLEISEKTVERHRSNLMKKLEAQSVAELVKLAMTAEIMTAD
ncbi:LuxR family transcriptional regulator [Rhodopirellula bahusiensis]|uniref:LuxR family transcriptional regulator n=1 Tax=Rhodopirellula bahusiensis TaxID=2014065 RepID=A0A2G1W4R2_9BACT|nr:LuxR family transcriptional regulator [Rhodopirellula bahusiensis]